jgi:CBS domain-containing protein
MNVGEACTRGALTVSPSAPLSDVAEIMCDRHVGAVVVTEAPLDKPVVVGIITDRDIVRAQLEHTADLSRLRTGEVMTRDPLVLNEQESIASAIGRLQARGVRRAPVINASGMLVGLVSTDDLLLQVSDELANLAQLVSNQPRREFT